MAISSRSSKFIENKKGTLDRHYQRGDFDERFLDREGYRRRIAAEKAAFVGLVTHRKQAR